MTRALLLNPPGRRAYSRDLWLSGEFEDDVRLPPLDLAVLSARSGAQWSAHDAIALGASPAESLRQAAAAKPDLVFFLLSGASFEEDETFMAGLRAELPRAVFAGLGDVYADVKDKAFDLHPFLDAVVLDAGGGDVERFLAGEREKLGDVLVRGKAAGSSRGLRGALRGLPDWSLFPLSRYRVPFTAGGKAATLALEWGCPFLCGYCPLHRVPHLVRPLESVLREAEDLARRGVKSLWLSAQAFGLDRKRDLELLEKLEPFGFSWVVSMRADLAEPGLLRAARKAGCAAVQFGLDSGDDEILRTFKKNTTRSQAEAALQAARSAGLKSWVTIVVGLTLDTRQSQEATLAWARRLPADRLSLRLDTQRYASGYRRQMLTRGLVPPEAMPPDTPSTTSVWQGRMGLSNTDASAYLERAAAPR